MSKSSIITVNERVMKVADMLIGGKSRISIIHYGSDTWSVGERQVEKYLAKARELIKGGIVKNLEFDYAKAIRRYEDLYQKAIDEKDYRLALSINKELTVLQGLHKMQIEHSGNVEFICNIPD